MKRKPSRGPREMAMDAAVGAHLRSARQLAGMSQGDLAGRVGVTFQQVQKYEKGTNRIGASRLQQFAEILNVPVSFFFEADDGVAMPAHLVVPEQDNATRGNANAVLALTARAAIEGGASARETMELLRQFGLIRDPMVRRAFIDLLRQVNIQNGAAQVLMPRPAERSLPVLEQPQAQSAE